MNAEERGGRPVHEGRGLCGVGEQFGVELFVAIDHGVDGERVGNAVDASKRELAPAFGVARQLEDALGERFRIRHCIEESAAESIPQDLLRPVRVGRDHRKGGGERFEDDVGHPLPSRGCRDEVEIDEDLGDVASPAEEDCAFAQAELCGKRSELRLFPARADDDQSGVRDLASDVRECFEQDVQAFLSLEATDEADQERVVAQCQRPSEGAARSALEALDVDGVADNGELVVRDARHLTAESCDRFADGDFLVDQADRQAVEQQVRAPALLGDAEGSDADGDARETRGNAPDEIRVKEEGVEDIDALPPQDRREAKDARRVVFSPSVQMQHGDAVAGKPLAHGAPSRQRTRADVVTSLFHAACQLPQAALGPADVELGDEIEDPDRVAPFP